MATHQATNRLKVSAMLDSLAQQIGAKSIEFWTARKGFNRIAKTYGYTGQPNHWNGVPVTVWSKQL